MSQLPIIDARRPDAPDLTGDGHKGSMCFVIAWAISAKN